MPTKSVATSKFTIPIADAVYLSKASLPAISKDDITPVLTGSFWRFDEEKVTAVSTDRYRVHRASVDVSGESVGQALIPRRALQWIVSNAGFFGRVRRMITEPTLSVTVTPAEGWKPNTDIVKAETEGPRGTATFTIAQNDTDDADTITLTVGLIAGNFPPIGKLLEKALEAERVVPDGFTNLDYVSGVSALARPGERGRVEFVQQSINNKQSQMIVTFERGAALIQQATS